MFRASFRLSNPEEARDWGRSLRDAAPPQTFIVAGFLDAKTVEAYIDVEEGTDVRSVTDALAQRLGFDQYEVTPVIRLQTAAAGDDLGTASRATQGSAAAVTSPVLPARESQPVEIRDDSPLRRVYPATITQVIAEPASLTLSVQVRHRRNECVAAVTVDETDDTVRITASVGSPRDHDYADCVSFAITFSWVAAGLDLPLGSRHIVRDQSSTPRHHLGASSVVASETPRFSDPATDERLSPIAHGKTRHRTRPLFLRFAVLRFAFAPLVRARRSRAT